MCRNTIEPNKDLKVVDNKIETIETQLNEVEEDIITLERFLANSDEHPKNYNLKQLITYLKTQDKCPKIIIGCESKSAEPFDTMSKTLSELNIRFEQLKGHSSTIAKMIKEYKTSDKLNAFLLNTQNYASGTNLENTTDIILYHKMDKDMENQIIGRAQRPGRKQSLRIWKFLNSSELEAVS